MFRVLFCFVFISSEDPNAFTERLQNKKVEKIGNPEDYGINVSGSKMVSAVTKKKSLDALIKLEKVQDLEPEAIEAIWITFLSEIHKFPGMITVITDSHPLTSRFFSRLMSVIYSKGRRVWKDRR